MQSPPNFHERDLTQAIQACLENAERLIEETFDLEFRQPCATRYFLAAIAQEEAAKAFILYLIRERVMPFTPAVRRSIRDHACKHLIGMIIDYMIMQWTTVDELQALIAQEYDLEGSLPNDVGSAIEILTYEKIGLWTNGNWAWAEGPQYHPAALKVAEGKKDRIKQDALYVRVGNNGKVATTPKNVTEAQTQEELEVAKRYVGFVRSLDVEGGDHSDQRRFGKVIAAFRLLFGTSASKGLE